MEDSHVANHAELRKQQSPNTQTCSINASIDNDNFPTPPPRPIKEALQDINNQINDHRTIIGNHGQQVSEKPQSTVSSAVSNLPCRVDSIDKHANHMIMTTSGQIMPWSDCQKTKGNVNIKLRDLCETLIVHILLSTF